MGGIKKRKKEQGTIFVVALLVIAVMLIISVPFLFKLSSQFRATEKSFKSLAALNLAEAGVERAIWELNYGDISAWSGDNDLRTMTISSYQASGGTVIGDIEISVTDPQSGNPVIEATGKVLLSGSLTVDKSVSVVIERNGTSPFDFAVFGNQGVDVQSSSMIDSYDSRLGAYGGENVGSLGHTGTNAVADSSITLDSSAEIYGDAVSGPESDPEEAIDGGIIYGSKLALSELKELPSIAPPQGLTSRGVYDLGTSGVDTISESGEYSSFDLGNSAMATITTDVVLYVTGNFNMDNNAVLEIADGASVIIYLGGSFEQKNDSQVNNLSQDPTKLMILGTNSFTSMNWKSGSNFWGAIYVPNANVSYFSGSELFGSVIASTVGLHSSANIHYDEALRYWDITTGSESQCSVKSWKEKIN